jgi:hypothetical protein
MTERKAIFHLEIKLITEMAKSITTAVSSIIRAIFTVSSMGNESRWARTSRAYKRRHLYEVNISTEDVKTLDIQMHVSFRCDV